MGEAGSIIFTRYGKFLTSFEKVRQGQSYYLGSLYKNCETNLQKDFCRRSDYCYSGKFLQATTQLTYDRTHAQSRLVEVSSWGFED